MIDAWVIDDGSTTPVSSEVVLETLRARIGTGQLETWLTSSSGRSLGLVTNADRAMAVLLDGEDDPGEHAVDPGAHGSSKGFVLANGQYDVYPNEDTVPIGEAFRIVEHIIREGSRPPFTRCPPTTAWCSSTRWSPHRTSSWARTPATTTRTAPRTTSTATSSADLPGQGRCRREPK
ncbi:hypothetical protein [Streptomyces sp. F63]|uniref:hypothetical protein n=1 Tax=Streptomyces sp. F63 TaxID=2824887 RepID=UPI0035AE86CC